MSKPFVFALALDTLGAARVESVIGVEPSGDPFNSIRLNAENHPFNPDGQCRRDRLLRPDPRGQGRRRVRLYQAGARPVCRARSRRRRRRLFFRKRHRRPQPRDRLSAAHQCRDPGQRGFRAGGLFPAMRHPGDGARYRCHGGHPRQPRHQSRDRRTGADAVCHLADALRHDELRHVRLRRGMDLPDRHPRQERRRRRHPRGAAGAARARQLFAETRQARQQRARHQGLRGAVIALRPAYAQPQRRRAQQHHRRLRHRQQPVAARAARARTEHPGRASPGRSRHRAGRARCRSPMSITSRASSRPSRGRSSSSSTCAASRP